MLNLAKPFAGFDRERMEAEAFGANSVASGAFSSSSSAHTTTSRQPCTRA